VEENNPHILVNAAFVLANFGEDIGATIGLVDRGLALNPSFARGWYVSGILRLDASQPDLAIEHIETSLRLSPRDRIGVPLFVMGQAYFFKRQFDGGGEMHHIVALADLSAEMLAEKMPVHPTIRMKSWYAATARSISIIADDVSPYSPMSRRRRSSSTTTRS
jgi:tetratricopeptide (TPR) repeat protein